MPFPDAPKIIAPEAKLFEALHYIAFDEAPLTQDSLELIKHTCPWHMIYGEYETHHESGRILAAQENLVFELKQGNLTAFHSKVLQYGELSDTEAPQQAWSVFPGDYNWQHSCQRSHPYEDNNSNVIYWNIHIRTIDLFSVFPPNNPTEFFADYKNGADYLQQMHSPDENPENQPKPYTTEFMDILQAGIEHFTPEKLQTKNKGPNGLLNKIIVHWLIKYCKDTYGERLSERQATVMAQMIRPM